jgi:heterodisulfide reductase subunit C
LAELANVRDCFQCQKCSAGCPVAFAMDYKPSQVIQMVSLGMKDRLLACKTIWICASCYTCSTRCPNEIDIAGVMDRLRQTALKEDAAVAEKEVRFFHAAFLDSVRTHGRVHELSMMARYKMKTRRYFDDMKLGWKMFTRGKLRIRPSKIKRKKEVAGLFMSPGAQERRGP